MKMRNTQRQRRNRCGYGARAAGFSLLLAISAVGAASEPWHSIDGGGGRAAGGTLTLDGVVGQPDATPTGGSWGGAHVMIGGFLSAPIAGACLADLDGSGHVGFDDLAIVLGMWGTCAAPPQPCPDIDGSGHVGFDDLAILLGSWGPC